MKRLCSIVLSGIVYYYLAMYKIEEVSSARREI